MPYVNVKIAGELTREQKQKIVEGITKVLEEVANKPPLQPMWLLKKLIGITGEKEENYYQTNNKKAAKPPLNLE